jgi:hypothetical protein
MALESVADVQRPDDDPDRVGDVRRVADDAAAALFHVEHPPNSTERPPVVVLLGGTGTGKSTLANRLLGAPDRGDDAVTATSFRRTFTAGCVAIARTADDLPDTWMGLPRRVFPPQEGPARGVPDLLTVVEHDTADGPALILVDTPDLDGDVPEHHRQADRAFRWAQAVVIVATPEKYQLPEVPRYAGLAARYKLPRRFVLNKADDLDAPDDWARQLGRLADGQVVHVVPRNDAPLSVDAERSLDALRTSLTTITASAEAAQGIQARCADVAGRATDAVLAPLEQARRRADDAAHRLRQLVRPEAGVDVHPMTRHLQRRLRQRSVLYLMGPQRMIDRAKAVPSLLARLPRTTWDLVTRGKANGALSVPEAEVEPESAGPDFSGELADGLRLLQGRCTEVLRDVGFPADRDASWQLDPDDGAAVADRELAELRRWLEARWDSKPRDTRALEWLAKHVPGGKHVTKLSEAAPYLLVASSAATSVVLGPVDQVVIGGYLLTTWLGEKLSNEVAAKTRQTNAAIAKGFADLCDRQADEAARWAGTFAPSPQKLAALEAAIERVHLASEGADS